LSIDEIKKIAYAVPMTVEELSALAVLQEDTLEEYGDRLVRHIKNFVKDESLEEYVDIHRCSVLPYEQTKKLMECIGDLTVILAQEEQLLGNNISCKFRIML
jgi:anion-transporting  ArsA/GET3 family ATPase